MKLLPVSIPELLRLNTCLSKFIDLTVSCNTIVARQPSQSNRVVCYLDAGDKETPFYQSCANSHRARGQYHCPTIGANSHHSEGGCTLEPQISCYLYGSHLHFSDATVVKQPKTGGDGQIPAVYSSTNIRRKRKEVLF